MRFFIWCVFASYAYHGDVFTVSVAESVAARFVLLNLDEDTLKKLDDEYELLAEEGATNTQIEASK